MRACPPGTVSEFANLRDRRRRARRLSLRFHLARLGQSLFIVAPLRLATHVIPELRQFLIEGLHHFSFLPQQIVNEALLAIVE
jgi:hypothetical protein